jgi:hypothetical protein
MDVLARVQLVTCYKNTCGVTFGLLTGYYTARRRDRAAFYCPNGHAQHFTSETEAERLAKELAWTRKDLEHVRVLHRDTERSNAALRGWATRRANKLSEPTDRNES